MLLIALDKSRSALWINSTSQFFILHSPPTSFETTFTSVISSTSRSLPNELLVLSRSLVRSTTIKTIKYQPLTSSTPLRASFDSLSLPFLSEPSSSFAFTAIYHVHSDLSLSPRSNQISSISRLLPIRLRARSTLHQLLVHSHFFDLQSKPLDTIILTSVTLASGSLPRSSFGPLIGHFSHLCASQSRKFMTLHITSAILLRSRLNSSIAFFAQQRTAQTPCVLLMHLLIIVSYTLSSDFFLLASVRVLIISSRPHSQSSHCSHKHQLAL